MISYKWKSSGQSHWLDRLLVSVLRQSISNNRSKPFWCGEPRGRVAGEKRIPTKMMSHANTNAPDLPSYPPLLSRRWLVCHRCGDEELSAAFNGEEFIFRNINSCISVSVVWYSCRLWWFVWLYHVLRDSGGDFLGVSVAASGGGAGKDERKDVGSSADETRQLTVTYNMTGSEILEREVSVLLARKPEESRGEGAEGKRRGFHEMISFYR